MRTHRKKTKKNNQPNKQTKKQTKNKTKENKKQTKRKTTHTREYIYPAKHKHTNIYKRDGNYTRMLRAILNKSWRQHPTRHQLYGHLLPITKSIQV